MIGFKIASTRAACKRRTGGEAKNLNAEIELSWESEYWGNQHKVRWEEKDFSAAKKAEFVYIAFGISRDVYEERTYGFEVETEQKGIAGIYWI